VPGRGDGDVSPTARRWLLGVGGFLLALAVVLVFRAGSSEHQRLNQAETSEARLERDLRATRVEVRIENRILRTAYTTAARLAAELAVGQVDLASTRGEFETAQGPLAAARSTRASQTSRLTAVRQCLDGVQRALDRTRVRDTAGATAFLRAAAPACQSALTGPGASAPVLAYDFADPFVMRVGGQYYAFATNAAGGSIQSAHSNDLTSWDFRGNVLAGLPPWAAPGSVWAPAALVRGPTTILYYTVREAFTGRQCISAAVGGAPGGPFLDPSTAPLECGSTGAIDPSPFVDANGNTFLLYKTERPARIVSRLLAPDGRSFAGPPREILAPSQGWEGGNVEAPSMLRNGSGYWLFYSGNDWNGRGYAQGVARCAGPEGPCTADSRNPVLRSGPAIAGPGGGEVFFDGSIWRLAYHGYREPLVRYPNSRLLHFARIDFDGQGRPVLVP
jgi:hypothetical protein